MKIRILKQRIYEECNPSFIIVLNCVINGKTCNFQPILVTILETMVASLVRTYSIGAQ